jgi:hypothetical protein
MKKLLVILLLGFSLEVITVSCNLVCPCGCSSGPQRKIDIISWNMETLSSSWQTLDTTVFNLHDQIVKVLSIDEQSLVQNDDQHQVGSVMNFAVACSPAPLEAMQMITGIKIISRSNAALKNENDLISIGQDISDRFVMAHRFESNFKSLDTFVGGLKIYQEDRYQLRVNEKPYTETKLIFDVIISLSDGKVSELKGEVLKIK